MTYAAGRHFLQIPGPSTVPERVMRAIDMPVSPNPSTRTFLPFSSSISHRSFSVDNPTSTSIIVMIQNLTTTWFSFQPFNS